MSIGLSKVVSGEYAEVVSRAKDLLAENGFGIVSEIEVTAILKNKLNLDFRPYVVLGACRPVLAHRAIEADTEAGLLLPCQVVVEDTGSGIAVRAVRPDVALAALLHLSEVREVAEDALPRLEAVLAAL